MADSRTSPAIATGRFDAPVAGLRAVFANGRRASLGILPTGTAFAVLSPAAAPLGGALALSLELPIGCRA